MRNQFPDHVALRAVATPVRGEPGLPPASFELTALTLGFEYVWAYPWLW